MVCGFSDCFFGLISLVFVLGDLCWGLLVLTCLFGAVYVSCLRLLWCFNSWFGNSYV